ncbi:MAG: hypothetical protein QM765_18205 [Myxococcales bacterium]
MLFISHDLRVVAHLADRVAVMYLGQVVESGPVERVYRAPAHPYTKALLSAALTVGRGVVVLAGEPPSPVLLPEGCRFHPRCPEAIDLCRHRSPPSHKVGQGQIAVCHRAAEVE